MKPEKFYAALLCLTLIGFFVICWLITQNENSNADATEAIRIKQEEIEQERDSVMQEYNIKVKFLSDQIDSVNALINTLTHTKTLSQSQINNITKRLEATEQQRLDFLKQYSNGEDY